MSYIEIQPHVGWYESTIEDFCDNICPHFGLDVSYKDVEFSGFWSQGDGASFTGNFYLSEVNPSNLKASLPKEVELHQLIDRLAVLAESHPDIEGDISRMSSLYSHSNTMSTGYWSREDDYHNEETVAFAPYEDQLIHIFRELADWLYSLLKENYDFYLADATVRAWSAAAEERKFLQDELDQLKADVAANPPPTMIQSNALNASIVTLEVEVESLTSKVDQLTSQFRYWPKGGNPYNIEQFYEDYF